MVLFYGLLVGGVGCLLCWLGGVGLEFGYGVVGWVFGVVMLLGCSVRCGLVIFSNFFGLVVWGLFCV